jgi:urea transport system substrate-binding protein
VNEAAYFQIYQFKNAVEAIGSGELTPSAIRDAAVGQRFMAPQGEIEIAGNLHTHLWPKIGQWQADGQAKVLVDSKSRVAPEPYWAYEGQECTAEGLQES